MMTKNKLFSTKNLFLIFFIGAIHFVFSQISSIDSLETVLSKQKTDSSRLDIGIKILKLKSNNYPEQALKYSDSLLLLKNIETFPLYHSKVLIFKMQILNRLAQYEKAIELSPQIEKIVKTHKLKKQELSFVNELGVYYQNLSVYKKASDAYYEAFKIAKELDDVNAQIVSLNNFSSIYLKTKEFNKAEKILLQALTIARTNKLNYSNGIILSNLGNLESERNNFPKARIYYNEALEIFEEVGSKYGQANVLNNLGYLEFQVRKYNTALEYFNKSEIVRKSINDRLGLVSIYVNKGDIYKELANWDKALENYSSGIQLSEEIKSYRKLEQALIGMAEVYERTNNYKTSLTFNKKLLALKDSLYQVDLNAELDKKKASVDSSFYEEQLYKLKQENNDFRKVSYLALAIVLIISTIVSIRYWRVLKRLKKNKETLSPVVNLEHKNVELKTNLLKEKLKKGPLNGLSWLEFGIVFEEIHPKFIKNITQNFNKLTNNELRICCLIKLGLNNYDLSDCLNINISSVRKARYRIYKKMDMTSDKDMANFLMSF